MSDLDLFVGAALDAQVPLRLDRRPAWHDVLSRAGAVPTTVRRPGGRRTQGRRRRVLLALALVLVGVLVAGSALAALGHNPFGGLTSWLSGAPGTPAPAAEQAGFAKRNGSSYAAFPKHTELRLLQSASAGGRRFSLLGFRNGGSLCLRVVPAAAPASRGVNQCVTLRELRRSRVPAVVASTAYFGSRGGRVTAIFGFADDTVRSVRLIRSIEGAQSVTATNNVFLVVHAAPGDPIWDPIVQITARTRTGRSVVLPFTTDGVVPLPAVPSYVRRARVVLPGPTRVAEPLPQAAIAWVDRREQRGERFRPNLQEFGSASTEVLFARTIQPDPDDAYRIGISVIRIGALPPDRRDAFGPTYGKLIPLRRGMLLLCHAELFPLRPAPFGYLCSANLGSSSLFEQPGRVLTVSRVYREAFTRVSGLAADGVREVDLYLASGRVIPAALHDNVYTVEAPSAQWPAKLVAYDAAGRPVEIDLIDRQSSQLLSTPCPLARLATSGSAAAVPRYERLDLSARTVDGRRILGRSMAEVKLELGPPAGGRESALLYGRTPSGDPALTISFARRRGAMRAVWFEYRDPSLRDARLGSVLRLQPPVLQARIATIYAGYGRGFAYGSEPALLGCTGIFRSRSGDAELTFGLDPNRPSRLFLRISDPRTS